MRYHGLRWPWLTKFKSRKVPNRCRVAATSATLAAPDQTWRMRDASRDRMPADARARASKPMAWLEVPVGAGGAIGISKSSVRGAVRQAGYTIQNRRPGIRRRSHTDTHAAGLVGASLSEASQAHPAAPSVGNIPTNTGEIPHTNGLMALNASARQHLSLEARVPGANRPTAKTRGQAPAPVKLDDQRCGPALLREYITQFEKRGTIRR